MGEPVERYIRWIPAPGNTRGNGKLHGLLYVATGGMLLAGAIFGTALCACVLPEVSRTAADTTQGTSPAGTAGESSQPAPSESERMPLSNAVPSAPQCAIDNGGCDTQPLAACAQSVGTNIVCTCPDAYSGNGIGAEGCIDIDECATDNGGCDTEPVATCENRIGGPPACHCPAGTTGKGYGSNGCVHAAGTVACGKYECDTSTVFDPGHGLTWQRVLPTMYDGCGGDRGRPGDSCTWQDAEAYCQHLSLDGAIWKLPSVEELTSIVTGGPPVVVDAQAFPSTPAEPFWTITERSGGNAYFVDFRDGTPHWIETSYTSRVRCVHR